MVRFLIGILFAFVLFVPAGAFAELGSYGYIVGTLDTTRSPYTQAPQAAGFSKPAYGLERLSQQGRFLHYIFFVNVNGTSYKVVVDVNDATIYQAPYRIVNMRSYNSQYYKGIFSSSGYVELNNKSTGKNTSKANGGLDFMRHPGILKDMAGGRGWTDYPEEIFTDGENTGVWSKLQVRQCNATKEYCPSSDLYYADAFDDLFKNVHKIYVFGEKFQNSATDVGMHNVHQNQGNRKNSFISNGATYQDGGVIFEYNNGDRKLLMVKFGDYVKNGTLNRNQLDFSYSNDFEVEERLWTTLRKREGEGANYYVDTFEFAPTGNSEKHTLKIGPFYAEQIEVLAHVTDEGCNNNYADVDVYMGDSPSISTANSHLIFARNNGCYNEYLRASTDLWQTLGASNPNRFYILVDVFSNGMSVQRAVNIIVRHK